MSKTVSKFLIVVVLTTGLLLSCQVVFGLNGRISLLQLQSAPEMVDIDGHTYVLETNLWRDCMPTMSPGDRSLIALIRITATTSPEFPSSVRADRLWLIRDERIWETVFSDEPRPDGAHRPNQREAIARNGPRWEPGSRVDAVVRLVDAQNRTYLLRASHQLIHQTD
ncbi:MAG: hypothetical protein ACFE0I_00965 [Elainellaceae cyanobacterium]